MHAHNGVLGHVATRPGYLTCERVARSELQRFQLLLLSPNSIHIEFVLDMVGQLSGTSGNFASFFNLFLTCSGTLLSRPWCKVLGHPNLRPKTPYNPRST